MTNIPEIGTLSIDRKIREERVERAQKMLGEIGDLLEEKNCSLRVALMFLPPGQIIPSWGVVALGSEIDAGVAHDTQEEIKTILEQNSCALNLWASWDSLSANFEPHYGIVAQERMVVV